MNMPQMMQNMQQMMMQMMQNMQANQGTDMSKMMQMMQQMQAAQGAGTPQQAPPPIDVKLDATDLHKIHSQQFQQKTILRDAARSSTDSGDNSQQAQQGPQNSIVEMFILENPPIEPHAALALRSLPPDMQMTVITRGSLAGARNPTAVLMGRIRAAKAGQISGKGDAQVDFLLSRLSENGKRTRSRSRSRSRSSSSSSRRSRKKRKRKKKKRKSSSSSSSSVVVVVEKEKAKTNRNTDVAASSSRSDVGNVGESADDVLTKLLSRQGN